MTERISVQKETDKSRLSSFLEKDRIWAGYAICDLEDELFPLCDWYVATENNDVIALCLHFKGLKIPTQITMGNPLGVEKILEVVDSPKTMYAHIPLTHREAVQKFYSFSQLSLMKRMAVSKECFKPVEGSAVRLYERDLADLERLYTLHPSGAFFRPYMLTLGAYYGVRKDGELVSAAGTHVSSPSHGMACIGNVFTDPSHRGKGYATACTSQVVKELLTKYDDIILNVDNQNRQAVRIYEKLGFREHCVYLEGLGTLKKPKTAKKIASSQF